jgi:hypothetical protein
MRPCLAALVALITISLAPASGALAQEYRLNQWRLALAGGARATIERPSLYGGSIGGSGRTAKWTVSIEGQPYIVQVETVLQARIPAGEASLIDFVQYQREVTDCRRYDPPTVWRWRPSLAVVCRTRWSNGEGRESARVVVEGPYDGHQLLVSAYAPQTSPPDGWATRVFSSIAALEETRRFDWQDVECGDFRPAAHWGMRYPTHFCYSSGGHSRETRDTTAYFRELGTVSMQLGVTTSPSPLTFRPTWSLLLPGNDGRVVALEVHPACYWLPGGDGEGGCLDSAEDELPARALIRFLQGAHVHCDARPGAPLWWLSELVSPWQWIALGIALVVLLAAVFITGHRIRRRRLKRRAP